MVTQGRVPYHEHDDSDIREALAQALQEGKKRRARQRMGAYALVVIFGAWGFYQVGATQDDLCAGAAANRLALREVVLGVANLGSDLILQDAQPGDYINPEQAQALETVEDFKKKQLERLELPVCK